MTRLGGISMRRIVPRHWRSQKKDLPGSRTHGGLCDLKIATLTAVDGPDAAIAFAETLPRSLLANWLVNRMVNLLIETGRLQDARDLLDEASEEARARQPYHMARIRLTAIQDGPEAALSLARTFQQAHPDRPAVSDRVAGLLEELDRHGEAINCLEPWMTPDAPWVRRRQFARLCRKAGQLHRAISALEDAERDLQAPPPLTFQSLAFALEDDNQLDKALAAIERGLQQHPASPSLIGSKARILRLSGRPDEALAFVERSIGLRPAEQSLALEVVRLLQLADRPQEAIAVLTPFIKDAKPLPVVGRLARLYMETGQPKDTIELLAALHETQETNAAMAGLLAQAYEEEGDEASALDAIEKGLHRFPDDPELLAQHWRLVSSVRGHEAAVDACHAARGDMSGSVQVQVKAFHFLSRLGDDEGAQLAFEAIAKADPDNEGGILAQANFMFQQKDAFAAKAILEKSRDGIGRRWSIESRLSVVLFWLGLVDDAIQLLERLRAEKPSDFGVVLRLADYKRHMGDFDGAKEALRNLDPHQVGQRARHLLVL